MKKAIAIIILSLFFVSTTIVKADPNNYMNSKGSSSLYKKGDMAIDVYYGFPNLNASKLDLFYTPMLVNSKSKSAFGPLGVKFEYLIGKKMGVGLDVNYSKSSLSWSQDGWDAKYNSIILNSKVSETRFAIAPRFYYHFVTKSKFDMYATSAIGYRSSTVTENIDAPYYGLGMGSFSIIPLYYRVAIGSRIFFSDNIGLNFEFGIGGALFTGGLACKL